jgi:hypothetical protein
MQHSHTPAPRANRTVRAPTGPQQNAEDAAASSPRTSEGPAPDWAPEAEPSDASPTAHIPQEPQGSPPSPRSFRPVHWDDPADVRAWLNIARVIFDELAALTREGSRRLKRRVMSRAELRRQSRDVERSLLALFDAADAGLAALLAEKGGLVE